MFYTQFYAGTDNAFSIIHQHPAKPYAEDLATYPNYFQVFRKPTFEEAEIIFKICKPSSLCGGIQSAKTEEIIKAKKVEKPDVWPNRTPPQPFS